MHKTDIIYKNTCDATLKDLGMQYHKKPDKCHAGIHAALGDTEGLLWHIQQGSGVEDTYDFMDLKKEKLIIITSRYCPRRSIIKMFECLKHCNADFHVTSTKTLKTALHMLSENINLMKKPSKDSIASKYVIRAINFLTKLGCDVNALDIKSRTVLSYYLEESHEHNLKIPIINVLLKNKADPNLPTDVNNTLSGDHFHAPNSLFLAIRSNWPGTCLELLVDKNVDTTAIDKENNTVLSLAAKLQHIEQIRWLLENVYELSESHQIKLAIKRCIGFNSKEKKLLNEWENNSAKRKEVQAKHAKKQFDSKKRQLNYLVNYNWAPK
nr:4313_t:CDS:1 [Entrophospora candida]CAG8622390.1 10412_t:CDS:1 [Entrophospora candida]